MATTKFIPFIFPKLRNIPWGYNIFDTPVFGYQPYRHLCGVTKRGFFADTVYTIIQSLRLSKKDQLAPLEMPITTEIGIDDGKMTIEKYMDLRYKDADSPHMSLVWNLNTTEAVGAIKLNEFIFSSHIRPDTVWHTIHWEKACEKNYLKVELNRKEVYGCKRKIRPQKGVGRSQQADRFAPHHIKGGMAYAKKPKTLGYHLPHRMVRNSLRVLLADRYHDGKLLILQDSGIPYGIFAEKLQEMGISNAVIIDENLDEMLKANIVAYAGLTSSSISEMTTKKIFSHQNLILTLSSLETLTDYLEFDSFSPKEDDYFDRKLKLMEQERIGIFSKVVRKNFEVVPRYLMYRSCRHVVYSDRYKIYR